jgi:hypothetical protein
MRRYLFSGSGTLRAIECPASMVLPQSDDAGSDAAGAGTNVHAFIDRAADVGRDGALAEVFATDQRGRDIAEAIDLGALPVDLMSAERELALAYDAGTRVARRLVDGDGSPILNREYERAVPPLGPREIPMTLDAVEWTAFDEVTVTDWKSGQPHPGYREQVTLGVLAVLALPEVTFPCRAVGQLVYLRGGVNVDRWDVTNADVGNMAEAVANAVDTAEALRGRVVRRDDVSPGEHCRWCSSRDACPEYGDVGRELATIEPASMLDAFRAQLSTPDGAANAVLRLPIIEDVVAQMRAELDAAAMRSPIALPDGSNYGPVTERGDRYVSDVDALHAKLAAAVGADKADSVMPIVPAKRKASIGAIEKTLGKPAMRELEAAGLVKRGADVTRVGIVKKAKGRAA